MGLLDGYFDPEQFRASGGLLGRLLSLPEMQGLYRPDADLAQAPSAPQMPPLQPMLRPYLPSYGQPPSDGQTPAPDLHSQYQALRPILGDRNAMFATVNPDVGKTLIAQALANQQPGDTGNVVSVGYRGGIPIPTGPVAPPPIPMPSPPPWWDTASKILQLYRGSLSGGGTGRGRGGGGDDEDECDKRLSEEMGRCYEREEEYAHQDFLPACIERAKDRWGLCVRNGRRFPPREPPEWGPDDEERWFNDNR
jgi:hypothetical protein